MLLCNFYLFASCSAVATVVTIYYSNSLDELAQAPPIQNSTNVWTTTEPPKQDPQTETATESPPTTGASGGAELVKDVSTECLSIHNAKRALHGSPSMTWDSALTAKAEEYALYLANKDLFEHASSSERDGAGENLYKGSSTSGVRTCTEATTRWYDEISLYDYNNPGFSSATGHFTQVVWKASTSLGCGIAKIRRGQYMYTYIVGRYKAHGNYQGKFSENVPRLL